MSNTGGTFDVSVGLQRIGRRAVLGTAAGAAGTALASQFSMPLSAAQDSTDEASESTKATFVLVPGQWTGAFVWHKVAPLLREAGHDVYAVTCTGLGDRVHLANAAIDLDTFITDVVNVLEYEDLHDVILVGHSFGGMIITGVAEKAPERLARVVYFDAVVPTDGQNSYDADYISEEARYEALVAETTDGFANGAPGFRPVSPGVVEWLQGAIADQAEAEWFISRLVPHPQLTNLQPLKLGNPRATALPRAFILCTADKDMEADPQMDSYVLMVESVRSDPNWTVIEMDDNHMANLNNPEGTVEALLSLI